MQKGHLAAICGLYCGACSVYRAGRDENPQIIEEIAQAIAKHLPVPVDELNFDNLNCDGCLGGGRISPHCRDCAIRLCAEQKPGVVHCAECNDFPCSIITDFNNDGLPHHAEVIENLAHMREIGVENWIREQEKRWKCPNCGTSMHWYGGTCNKCGTVQPDRLSKLPGDES